MVKLNRIASIAAATSALVVAPSVARAHGNAHGLARTTLGKATVTIEYNGPSLKGRNIGKMIHPGELWRLGADIPTTIESTTDLDFGGARVPRGKHILLARLVEPGKWTLVVSSQPIFKYEPSAKIAEVPFEVSNSQNQVEQLSIQLSSQGKQGTIEVAWGTARLIAFFSVAP